MMNESPRKKIILTAVAALGVAALVGCAGDDAPRDEKTAVVRDAICGGGGGSSGGGGACTDVTGVCPAECGYCFNSVAERVTLKNLWSCNGTNETGGGGAGGACTRGSGCSNTEISQAQAQCRSLCALPGIDSTSRGIHECHLTYQQSNYRLVSFTCDCAEGFDIPGQVGTYC